MTDDPEIEYSPLSGPITEGGVTVNVRIFRIKGSVDGWSLEVEDEDEGSTVYSDFFETDQAALNAFHETVRQEGMHVFQDDEPTRH